MELHVLCGPLLVTFRLIFALYLDGTLDVAYESVDQTFLLSLILSSLLDLLLHLSFERFELGELLVECPHRGLDFVLSFFVHCSEQLFRVT